MVLPTHSHNYITKQYNIPVKWTQIHQQANLGLFMIKYIYYYYSPHRAQKLCFGYKSEYDGRENFRIALLMTGDF